MSRKQPNLTSVMQSLMVLNTYCHYEPCEECIFNFNGGHALFSTSDTSKKCFLHSESWCLHKFELLCDYVERLINIRNCNETDTNKARIKYKLALYLLKEWKQTYSNIGYSAYKKILQKKKQKYKEVFSKIIIDELLGGHNDIC